MTSISENFPSSFMTGKDLQGGPRTLRIDYVELNVPLKGGTKPVLHFIDYEKGLPLNFTNASAIARMYGDDCDYWHTCQVMLVFDPNVEFKDEKVGGIRVREDEAHKSNGPRVKKAAQQWQPRQDDSADIPY